MKDKRLFAFAGLWERWRGPDGKTVETCAILTTEPSQSLKEIHDRMPVILDPKDYEQWLDPYIRQAELLQPLLCPYPDDALTTYPVSLRVNDPAHDDAACTDPL
jgi:putative SOS response-associated peptidase YedK